MFPLRSELDDKRRKRRKKKNSFNTSFQSIHMCACRMKEKNTHRKDKTFPSYDCFMHARTQHNNKKEGTSTSLKDTNCSIFTQIIKTIDFHLSVLFSRYIFGWCVCVLFHVFVQISRNNKCLTKQTNRNKQWKICIYSK